jgi:hypothetical protein
MPTEVKRNGLNILLTGRHCHDAHLPTLRMQHGRNGAALSELITAQEAKLLTSWLRIQIDGGSLRSGRIKEDELKEQSRRFLREFVQAMKSGNHDDIQGAEWTASRELLGDYSNSRAVQGFTPTETATFIFSMKEPVFALLREHGNGDARQLAEQTWAATKVLDKLGLFATEVYQQSRDSPRNFWSFPLRLCNCGIISSCSRSSARWTASAPRT